MTARLAAICALIEKADVIADVGCDHGIVAEYVVKNALAKKTIASDVSERCLDKARDRLNCYDGIEFICCDGLGYECDEAVIAGMGGHTVIGILDRAKKLPLLLVLCAHKNTDAMRRTLVSLGYEIVSDRMTEERGKFYSVIRAELNGNKKELSELQYLFGACYTERSDVLRKYLLNLQDTYMRAAEQNKDKLEFVREALKGQGVTPDATK